MIDSHIESIRPVYIFQLYIRIPITSKLVEGSTSKLVEVSTSKLVVVNFISTNPPQRRLVRRLKLKVSKIIFTLCATEKLVRNFEHTVLRWRRQFMKIFHNPTLQLNGYSSCRSCALVATISDTI